MSEAKIKLESLRTLVLLLFGFVALPGLVYVVGQLVVGGYEGEGGVASLYTAIYRSLGQGNYATWTLVLSPCLVVQLLRLALVLHRTRKAVTRVTD